MLELTSPAPLLPGRLRLLEPGGSPQPALLKRLTDGTYDKPFIEDCGPLRYLHFDLDNVQSVMRHDDPDALCLAYTRKMMTFLLFNAQPRRMLQLGLGGGSLAKFCYRHLPDASITVVEIDPNVLALREEFRVPPDDERFQVVQGDGVAYIAGGFGSAAGAGSAAGFGSAADAGSTAGAGDGAGGGDNAGGQREGNDAAYTSGRGRRARAATKRAPREDVILVDACDRNGLSPTLAAPDLYANLRRRLAVGGVLVMNICGEDFEVESHVARIRGVFGERLISLPAKEDGNLIVLGFRSEPSTWEGAELDRHARRLEERFGLAFPRYVRQMSYGLRASGKI